MGFDVALIWELEFLDLAFSNLNFVLENIHLLSFGSWRKGVELIENLKGIVGPFLDFGSFDFDLRA